MSGTTSETDTTDTTSTAEATQNETTEKVEIDWKAKSREWEKRAKANADAAAKLAEIEESQKTEAQKLTDAKAAAEQAAAEAKADALRWRIAAKFGISDDKADLYLTGTDEDTLTKQAQGLAEMTSTTKTKSGNYVPKEGSTSGESKPNEMREFTRQLFGKE